MAMAKSLFACFWALSLAFVCSTTAKGAESPPLPTPILLWTNGAPGSEGKTAEETVRLTPQGEHIVSNVHRPSITPYFPTRETATGAAVIVVPGGGHRELWMDHEGYRVGQWLSDHGIAAFVLKYRLSKENGSTYTIEGNALPDVQRAIRLVRSHASDWNIGVDRIGVIGFSAGGELAALAGTQLNGGEQTSTDPIDRESTKPAFIGLIYPAIPQGLEFSGETPPVFLLCGEDDDPVISLGVPRLYLALKQAGVSAEMHVLSGAGHGFGIRATNPPAVAAWPSLFYAWLGTRGILKRK
jgi:acetyl esterase/lipase